MQNLLEQLKKVLAEDDRLMSEGELLKNKVIELAIKLDKDLIQLLLTDKQMKEVFFTGVGEAMIFDKDKFIKFVSNKQFLPDSYTAFKNKIGLTEDGEFIREKKEVVLSWPYKDCVLEGGMTKEDQKRDEIFWNQTLAPDEISRLLDPKVFINAKRIDKKGEHKFDGFRIDENGNIKDNLIIKGNNLLALHSLKKRFAGEVKLIYIDPPYNTGGEANIFTYNNSFNHSTWLTFMKNRLNIARQFLAEDGFIAIAIDHNELFYLGTLSDEIFGRDNLLGIINIVIRPQGRQFSKFFSETTEYMLVYAKNRSKAEFNNVVLDEVIKAQYNQKDSLGNFRYIPLMYSRFVEEKLEKAKEKYFYPIYVSRDLREISLIEKQNYYEVWPINNKRKICWKIQKEKFKELLETKRERYKALKDKSGNVQIYEKFREGEGTKIKTHWIGKRYNATESGTELLKEILGEKIFSYPKSLYAVLDTLKIMTKNDDIILDFFAGSGTTGHATLELNKEDGGNRKFILVEQLQEHIDICTERIQKVIHGYGGDFVYIELAKWNENFVDEIKKAKTTKELQELWGMLKEKAYLSYKVDPARIDANAKNVADLSVEDQKRFLLECLDQNHLYINYSEIDDKEYGVSEEDKKLNREFYGN